MHSKPYINSFSFKHNFRRFQAKSTYLLHSNRAVFVLSGLVICRGGCAAIRCSLDVCAAFALGLSYVLWFSFFVCVSFSLLFYKNHNPCIAFLFVPLKSSLTCRPSSQFPNHRNLFVERRHVLILWKNSNWIELSKTSLRSFLKFKQIFITLPYFTALWKHSQKVFGWTITKSN